MKRKYLVIFLLLFLAVGYAGVSTIHKMEGNIDIGYESANYIVEFTGVYTDYGVFSYNEKTIDFKTINLKNIKDEALLEFDVANKSLEYDAEVMVGCTLKDNSLSLSEYLNITTDIKNPVKVESGNLLTGLLTVKMKKAYTGANGITPELICTMSSKPISRTIVGKEYVERADEPILNGADPVLDSGGKLVPVKVLMDGTVTMADTTKRWYSYKAKSWANAVILIGNPSKKYAVGDTIKEADIESYFVWIPRYRYQIFNKGDYTSTINSALPTTSNAKEIQIEFESKESEVLMGNTVGSWRTHPAFTNYNTAGLWVGKFEAGYKGATTTKEAEQDVIDASKLIVKPNVYSWRNVTLSKMFKTSLGYQRDLVSHMMRNTEWGALAYLSHSKYGINDEIKLNDNSAYLTGYGSSQPYNTEVGYKASTTGNISGVYDMSGGAWEYVAGNRSYQSGNSGFTTTELKSEEYSKHIDIYADGSSLDSYSYRRLGDATGELGPFYNISGFRCSNWYSDMANFLNNGGSWFKRGGGYSDGDKAGQFTFVSHTGPVHDYNGFRITLAINN